MAQRHHVRIPIRPRHPVPKAQIKVGNIFPTVLEVATVSPVSVVPLGTTNNKPSLPSPKGSGGTGTKEQHLLGTDHSLGNYISYAFLRGRGHHIVDAISNIFVDGSHARVMNSGEHVLAAPLVRAGTVKPGRAQRSILLLSANVDPCARHSLINTNSYKYPANDRIYLPWGQSIALVTIKFTAIGVNVGTAIWATGLLRNTILSSDDGICRWTKDRFATLHQSSSLDPSGEKEDKELIIFRGIDIVNEEKCFSIEVENIGDRQLQILAELEILFLSN